MRPQTASRSPALDGNDSRAAARRAALQAVGLVFPEKQKDLSTLEAEQDRQLDRTMRLSPSSKTFELDSGCSGRSAAQLLMEQWRAKNVPPVEESSKTDGEAPQVGRV